MGAKQHELHGFNNKAEVKHKRNQETMDKHLDSSVSHLSPANISSRHLVYHHEI